MDWIIFLTLALAAWRIGHLLASEGGPAEILSTLRYWLGVRYKDTPPYEAYGKTVFAKGIICLKCNSVWVGLFWGGLYALYHPLWLLALPFALSAAAIIVETILETKEP